MTQAAAAAADRPTDTTAVQPTPAAVPAARTGSDDGKVVPLRWRERAEQSQDAVTNERRRRREIAVPERPTPPPQDLSERLRATSLLALPDDDFDDDTDETSAAAAAAAEEEVSQ
ncbi:hypothetical protein ACFWEB_24395 [Streptomyces parvus]|uniref:hypothetical protein n=1 Tax=Streptomyces parvus TaxID=66428 RepID=UPI0036545E33